MKGGASTDPYLFGENPVFSNPNNNYGYQDVNNKTVRSQTVNQGIRNLILFNYGCSNGAGVAPGSFIPVNSGLIDNLNLYDGVIYAAANPLLSCNTAFLGLCNIMMPLSDALIQNSIFDRVIIVPCAIGGTVAAQWASDGPLYNKISVGMKRLKALGITPSTPGCTFALLHVCGENDTATTQVNYQAQVASNTAKIKNDGFSGRIFVPLETLLSNVTNPTIRAAQAALVDNVNYFSGGDLDVLTGSTYRQSDNTHFTLAGQSAAANIIYNAMIASGAPF